LKEISKFFFVVTEIASCIVQSCSKNWKYNFYKSCVFFGQVQWNLCLAYKYIWKQY